MGYSGARSLKSNKILFQALSSFNGDYFNEYVTDKRCPGGGYGETTVLGSWSTPRMLPA